MSITNKVVHGKFSKVSGTGVRHVYDASGNHLGVIMKLDKEHGGGYKAIRTRDGKSRVKPLLADAFKTIRRSN